MSQGGKPLKVSSSFPSGGTIPQKYTCDGDDISPPIDIEGIPSEAREIVIFVEDPDAPGGTFIHWVVYGIPVSLNHLPENADKLKEKYKFFTGRNDFGRLGYGGPCPPRGHGQHRYYFKVFAVSERMQWKDGLTRDEVWEKIKGKVVATGETMGRYGR